MRPLARTAALSRLTAPTRGELYDLEIIPIRCVPPWLRWLYFELVMLSDFSTGLVVVHRARLLALLDFDQPERGPRLPTVSPKQLREGLCELSEMGFVRFDSVKNKRNKELEIYVPARHHFRSSAGKQGREQGRPAAPRKASNGAGSKEVVHRNRADSRARGSEENLSSVGSPLVDNFGAIEVPVFTPAPRHVSEKLQAIRKSVAARRGGDK